MKNIKLTILILFIISFSFADTTIPGEFTFSDCIGSFEYYLPAGVYDIYTKRLFYEDAIFYNVEVIEGEYTLIFIPLTEMVKMEDHEISNSPFLTYNLNNYPNPFNPAVAGAGRSPATAISFSIPNNSYIELSIFNIKGQKVKTLVNKVLPAGAHSVTWNGRDSNGKRVSSGIYFYKFKAGDFQKVRKMVLIK